MQSSLPCQTGARTVGTAAANPEMIRIGGTHTKLGRETRRGTALVTSSVSSAMQGRNDFASIFSSPSVCVCLGAQPVKVAKSSACSQQPASCSAIVETPRELQEITVKLFVSCATSADAVDDAIALALERHKTSFVDTLIVSMRHSEPGEHGCFAPLWAAMESHMKGGTVKALGVCDLDADHLRELLEHTDVHPSLNHVRMETVSKELVTLARAHSIRLVIHSDAPDFLDAARFSTTPSCESLDDHHPYLHFENPMWVMRSTVVAKYRSVVLHTSYVAKALVEAPLVVD